MKKLISVVVPMYNEAAGIRKFLDGELLPALKTLDVNAEIILVDDGSSDQTLEKVKTAEILKAFLVKILALTRNFGKEAALTAGLKEASGDAAIMIDADGQHPADKIPEMVAKWQAGALIVTAVRGENTTKHKLGSRLYYRLLKMMGQNVTVGAMDFRLLDRAVIDEFLNFTERNRLTRGLIDWLGFPQEYIKVRTKNREQGRPTYSFRKLATLASDSFVSMSRTPLLIFGYIGLFIMVFSGLLGLFILIQQYILGDPLHLDWSGAVAMSVFVSFLVGLVLVSQAMTALYISQIHAEAKNRPLYVINRQKSVLSPAPGNSTKPSTPNNAAPLDKKEQV